MCDCWIESISATWNLLEMQRLWSQTRPIQSETLGRSQFSLYTSSLGDFFFSILIYFLKGLQRGFIRIFREYIFVFLKKFY